MVKFIKGEKNLSFVWFILKQMGITVPSLATVLLGYLFSLNVSYMYSLEIFKHMCSMLTVKEYHSIQFHWSQ